MTFISDTYRSLLWTVRIRHFSLEQFWNFWRANVAVCARLGYGRESRYGSTSFRIVLEKQMAHSYLRISSTSGSAYKRAHQYGVHVRYSRKICLQCWVDSFHPAKWTAKWTSTVKYTAEDGEWHHFAGNSSDSFQDVTQRQFSKDSNKRFRCACAVFSTLAHIATILSL